MTIKVCVSGAKGKMGSLACQSISLDKTLDLVATAEIDDDLTEVIKSSKAEVVLDLTAASVVYGNVKKIIQAGASPVVGTSGLSSEQIAELSEQCNKANLSGLIVPNFSIGAVLMMRFAAEAAAYMPQAEILEIHHDKKEDSPSGTAIRTAQMIDNARVKAQGFLRGAETYPGARGAEVERVGIHSMRLPGHVAHQMLVFGGTGESLTIRHDSIDRQCFMPGVVLACKKVKTLSGLNVGLENVLSFDSL